MTKQKTDRDNSLATRYRYAVCNTRPQALLELEDLLALTWRPGDNSGNFVNKLLRPIGAAVLVAIRYFHELQDDRAKNASHRIPVCGFKAVHDQEGQVSYDNLFMYDGRRVPVSQARGRVIDPDRNPSLLDLVLYMHRTAQKFLSRTQHLPVVPMFPRIKLGFAPSQVPVFCETPQLRAMVARRLDIPVGRLSSKQPALLLRMYEDVWNEMTIAHDAPDNNTGLTLVDAELCHTAHQALRVFEDFSDMVGLQTWNPSREVLAPSRKNPATAVLKAREIDLSTPESQEALSMDALDVLVADMRRHLGGGNEMFSNDDIFRALLAPRENVTVDIKDPADAIARIGNNARVVQAMRELLPDMLSEGTTDVDLLVAAHHPAAPLRCSGICRPQILRLQPVATEFALDFHPGVLGRRIHANLYRPWHRPSVDVTPSGVAHAEPMQAVSAEG